MLDVTIDIAVSFWNTMAEMAPWLLFGFLAAGVLSVFFSPRWIERHLGGRGAGPVLKASLLGVPLPLCSCGVIPVSAGLYRHGASRGATSSFLLSTPQTGVDSIFATYALMGPVYAVVRPVIAMVSGVLGGLVIDRVTAGEPQEQTAAADEACSSSKVAGCCGSSGSGTDKKPAKWKAALRYALVVLPADIAGSLVIGLAVAALLTALVPADALSPYLGGGLVAMLAAVAFSTPLYVCATGSIPIGLGLLAVGASPGAVLAFLIAGPATNAATLSVTWKVLGRRTGIVYLLTVVVVAIAAGLGLDAMFTVESLHLPAAAMHGHEHGMTWMDHVWAALLLLLLLPAIGRRFFSSHGHDHGTGKATEPEDASDRPTVQTLTVTGLHCSRCVEAVERGLREVSGVSNASVDLRTGRAEVTGQGVDRAALGGAVEALGYGVKGATAPAALQSTG